MKSGGETVLVTGASSGIGEALARVFAAHGHDLILVARSADKLKQLADQLARKHSVAVSVHPADLAVPGAAGRLAKLLEREGQQVDILINNAGVTQRAAFVEMKPEEHQRILQLNVVGFTDMLAHFLPGMVSRQYGRVLNVSSVTAFLQLASFATYSSTKAYILCLSEILSEELRGTGVTVTALCPGITDTRMIDEVTAQSAGLKLPSFAVADAGAVAKEGYRACMKGEPVVVPGALNVATVMTSRATPKWLWRRMTGFVWRLTK